MGEREGGVKERGKAGRTYSGIPDHSRLRVVTTWPGGNVMRLTKLKLRNFRCYSTEVTVSFDDLTAIVGKNDAGKSTIMDALAIFFEEAKLDRDDAAVDGDRRNVQITCEFSDLPEKLVIDADYETNLADELLVNAAGNLEVRKSYDGSLATPKLTKVEALAVHPTAPGADDLLSLKRPELLARANEIGADLADINKAAKSPIRAAIRNAHRSLELAERYVPLEEDGSKHIWAALSQFLPAFALFKSDRASTDQDAEAQDPLRSAIKEAIKELEPKLLEIQTSVENEVRKIADLTVEKIREMDPQLAGSLNPIISTKKWDSLFNTNIVGDNGIPLNKRGSGVKRLVLINFFRAAAEKAARERDKHSVIYAVEEPETSQHPANQRMLVAALGSLAAAPGRQVILTTHTPMLARAIPDSSLRYISDQQAGGRTFLVGGPDVNSQIASSLGVLPDHNVRLFIGVEGKHDISFLKGLSRVLRNAGQAVPDLEAKEVSGEIIFFPFGGSNLALWSSRLSPLNRPEYHICDRDNQPPAHPKYHDHVTAVNGRAGCTAISTNKREMENYLHPDSVRECYAAHNIHLHLPPVFGDFDDVPEIVARAVHAATTAGAAWPADPDTQRQKIGKAKSHLNVGAVGQMTLARLRQTDQQEEVLGWFGHMQATLNEAGA